MDFIFNQIGQCQNKKSTKMNPYRHSRDRGDYQCSSLVMEQSMLIYRNPICALFYDLLLHSRVKVSQTHTHIYSLSLSRCLVALLAVLLWPALPAHYFCTKTHSSYRWIEAAEKAAISHNTSNNSATMPNSSFHSKSLPRDAKRKEPLGQANASTYESIRQKTG